MIEVPSTAAEAIEAKKLIEAAAGTADAVQVIVLAPASTLEEGRGRVLAERTSLARRFAERVADLEGVEDVVVTELEPDLRIAVVLSSLNLDTELHLQAVMIEVARQVGDASVGEVVPLVVGEDDPPAGESLLQN